MYDHGQATIERCPHDTLNPYLMVNRNLIRDESISPECRWLIIYLLANAEGWIIKMSQLINHLKDQKGKNKVYEIVDEAIAAGYMKRQEVFEGNLKRGFKYYVSETRRYSKNVSDIPVFGIPNPEIPKSGTLKNKQLEEIPKERENVAPSAIATDSTNALLLSIKKYKPDFKDPNIKAWNEEMDFLLRLDNRSIADVKKVIDWVSSSVFWRKIILSPKNLRKNFDRLQLEMMDSKQSMETINRNLADKMKLLYPMQVACGEIQISEEYIELGKGSRVQEFRFSDKNFYPSVRDFLRSMMLPIHEFN